MNMRELQLIGLCEVKVTEMLLVNTVDFFASFSRMLHGFPRYILRLFPIIVCKHLHALHYIN